MPRFMGFHTFPKNAFSYEQVCQLAAASQQDPAVKGYRSFVSPDEGRAVCILDAPDRQSVVNWFKKVNMPTDAVVEVTIEGDCGMMRELGDKKAVGARA